MSMTSKSRRDARRRKEGRDARHELHLHARNEWAADSRNQPLPPPPEPIEDLLPRLERGLSCLQANGVRVNPSSRLPRMVALLRSRPPADVEDPEIADRTTAAIEGPALADIFQHLDAFIALPGWRPHFEDLLSGQFVPLSEGPDPARAKQLELWVAARALSTGAQIELSNPDVLLRDELGEFVVEAKRLVSQNRVQANIEKATDQVLDSGRQGVIALDVSRLLGLHDGILHVDTYEQARDDIYHRVAALSAQGEFRRWIRRRDPGGQVKALFAVVFTATILRETHGIMTMRSIIGGPIDPWDLKGKRLFERVAGNRARVVR